MKTSVSPQPHPTATGDHPHGPAHRSKLKVSTSHVSQECDIYRKLGDQTLADKCQMELSNEKQKPDMGWKSAKNWV